MSCGGFGSSCAADDRTAPLLEPVVGPRTSSGRGVATILSLAESRSIERARVAFRKANEAALEGAEKLSEFSSWRRVSFQSRGSLKPRSSMDVEGPGLSWPQVAVTVWSSLMSTGIVALPYALSAAGWAGLLLICAAAAVTAYTGKLLAASLHTVNSRKRRMPERHMGEGFACTYDQLAKEVLGPSGGMLMQLLTLLECLGSAVCLIVLQAANWPSLIELQLPGWLSPSLVVALASGARSHPNPSPSPSPIPSASPNPSPSPIPSPNPSANPRPDPEQARAATRCCCSTGAPSRGWARAATCCMPPATCHLLHATCYMPPATCPLLHATCPPEPEAEPEPEPEP